VTYDADNPAVVKAYALWCKPTSYREIARRMGLSERVVSRMVQAERERRRSDVAAERDAIYAQNVASYEVIRDRMLSFLGSGDAENEAKCAAIALKAVNALDRMHGLDAPAPTFQPSASPLTDAVRALKPDEIMALVRAFANRESPAPEKRVDIINPPNVLKFP